METRHTPTTETVDELACALRDGLLQDLLAVSMLIEGARRHVEDEGEAEAHELLSEASATVRANVSMVRMLITRLRAADATTADAGRA